MGEIERVSNSKTSSSVSNNAASYNNYREKAPYNPGPRIGCFKCDSPYNVSECPQQQKWNTQQTQEGEVEEEVNEEQEEEVPFGSFSHALFSIAQEEGDSNASIWKKKGLVLIVQRC